MGLRNSAAAASRVVPGEPLTTGQAVGGCGNSGNSTEPHLHVQVVDRMDIAAARGLPVVFGDGLPRNGRVVDVP